MRHFNVVVTTLVAFLVGAGAYQNFGNDLYNRLVTTPPGGQGWDRLMEIQKNESLGVWPLPVEGKLSFTVDWVSPHTEIWEKELDHLKDKPGIRGLEIGSFEGRSAVWWLDNILTAESSRLTCIDIFSDRLNQYFDHNIALTGKADRVNKITGKSQVALRGLPISSFDFIYIDGCHLARCALADLVLSWELLKPGGVVIVDDYLFMESGPLTSPKPAVDAFLSMYAPELQLRYLKNQAVVRKR